jgi:thioredoxin-like negative regulator of GroEL
VTADRPILLEFYKPDCHFCARLHDEVWRDERVAALLAQLTRARADISTPGGTALAERYEVSLFPALRLVDLNGRVLDRYDGLPPLDAARSFLEKAAARRTALGDDPTSWSEMADFAAGAGVLKLADDTYKRVIDDPRTVSVQQDGARLKRGRVLERLGDLSGAAGALEPFAAAPSAESGATRPGLDLLIRVRKALGDREGEARAREAFTRLFPELHPPD